MSKGQLRPIAQRIRCWSKYIERLRKRTEELIIRGVYCRRASVRAVVKWRSQDERCRNCLTLVNPLQNPGCDLAIALFALLPLTARLLAAGASDGRKPYSCAGPHPCPPLTSAANCTRPAISQSSTVHVYDDLSWPGCSKDKPRRTMPPGLSISQPRSTDHGKKSLWIRAVIARLFSSLSGVSA